MLDPMQQDGQDASTRPRIGVAADGSSRDAGSVSAVPVRVIRCVEDAVDLPASSAVVVLDVLRATTTIMFALAAGAESIVPLGTVDAARLERDRRPGSVLAGERLGVPPAGFDLGNSPSAMTVDAVGGRTVVISTTNGTRAILAAAHCRRVVMGALVNSAAVAEALVDDPGPIVLLCAGAHGEPGVEDDLGAGAIIAALAQRRRLACDDGAVMVLHQWESVGPDGCEAALRAARAGVALQEVGLGADIPTCAALDSCPVVGEWRPDQGIREIRAPD